MCSKYPLLNKKVFRKLQLLQCLNKLLYDKSASRLNSFEPCSLRFICKLGMACRSEHALLGIELDLQIIVQVRTCLPIIGVPAHVQLLLCCDPHSANVTVIFVFLFTVALILQMKADFQERSYLYSSL